MSDEEVLDIQEETVVEVKKPKAKKPRQLKLQVIPVQAMVFREPDLQPGTRKVFIARQGQQLHGVAFNDEWYQVSTIGPKENQKVGFIQTSKVVEL